ncbi:MAG: sensor histidine kinase [Bacteroidales bacterium]|nr:sensor histidine kinase [Bacteroidales bacterium]
MKFKNKKRAIYFNNIASIVFVIGTSTIISYFFRGPGLFSSFLFYLKYSSFGFALGFSFWLGHHAIGRFTEKKLDWTKNPKKANIISLLMYIIFGLIICTTIPYVFHRFVWGDLTGKDLFLTVLVMSIMIFSLDMIVISLFYSTYLTKYWKKSIEANEELKRETLLAKYEALKNQVNPHFLFNSLNTLSGIVEQKTELATGFIKKLSDIYRYVLEQSDKELVSLDDEMKFVEDYIFLSKMRFGEALIFHSNLPADNTIQIVPLGIQMLVENAIKHNIVSDDMPLKIEITVEDGFIIVRNNIQKKKTVVSKNEPLGLENLKNRYAYLTNSSIEIIDYESEFAVKLPLLNAHKHELPDY